MPAEGWARGGRTEGAALQRNPAALPWRAKDEQDTSPQPFINALPGALGLWWSGGSLMSPVAARGAGRGGGRCMLIRVIGAGAATYGAASAGRLPAARLPAACGGS